MLRYFVLLLIYGFCSGAEPKPILVIREQNSWRDVIGSDSPTFALYDDGTFYYLRAQPTAEEPFEARKTAEPDNKVKELLGFNPVKMKARYELSEATDQVTTVIWTPKKRIEIYGQWRKVIEVGADASPSWKAVVAHERTMWESLPVEVRTALRRVDQQRAIKGNLWLPAKIEVVFWPYEYAPEESIVWPEAWPRLSARDTRKRGNSFSVFLPSEYFSELQNFLATRKEKGAVLIDGKKMAVAIRFPFPAEDVWMR